MAETTAQVPGAGSTEPEGTADQAKEKAQEVAGQAQEKLQEASGEAKSRLRSQVDERSTQAGERVASTASDVRSVGAELRKQGKDAPAKIADQAADRAERLGGYLRDSDAERILRDVEDFGRRQPWAVALGGLALGFAASRFLKASSTDRYRQGRIGPAAAMPPRASAGPTVGNGVRSDREVGGPSTVG